MKNNRIFEDREYDWLSSILSSKDFSWFTDDQVSDVRREMISEKWNHRVAIKFHKKRR
jgi:hypothetical protein